MERDRMEENGMRRRADKAFVGWLLVVGLVVVGTALLAVGASRGAAAWPAWVFLGCGVAAVAAHGVWVFLFFNRLERRLPEQEERFQRLGSSLGATFLQLGAGDLVRAVTASRDLPERVAAGVSGAGGGGALAGPPNPGHPARGGPAAGPLLPPR